MAKPLNNISGQDDAAKEERARLKREYIANARETLGRAKTLLEGGAEHELTYAALELRQAFEALVYEHALGYTDELVGEDYLVWQPTQLLEKILEINPLAEGPIEMSIQDPKTGEWHKLGTEARIALGALKKRYFALGNRLHTRSLSEAIRNKPVRSGSLRKLCEECVALIERDLNASMRMDGSIFGTTSLICKGCGTKIIRRIDALRTPQNSGSKTKEAIGANCPGCLASYTIMWEDDGHYWSADKWRAKCPYSGCDGVHEKWKREVRSGMVSKCPACGTRSKVVEGFTFIPEEAAKRIGK
jgi:RNase P subunit RPR2